jgi:hypothetical protein
MFSIAALRIFRLFASELNQTNVRTFRNFIDFRVRVL